MYRYDALPCTHLSPLTDGQMGVQFLRAPSPSSQAMAIAEKKVISCECEWISNRAWRLSTRLACWVTYKICTLELPIKVTCPERSARTHVATIELSLVMLFFYGNGNVLFVFASLEFKSPMGLRVTYFFLSCSALRLLPWGPRVPI